MDDWMPDLDDDVAEAIVSNKSKNKIQNAMTSLEDTLDLANGSTKMPKSLAKNIKQDVKEVTEEVKSVIKLDSESFEDKEFIQTGVKTLIIKLQSTIELMEGSMLVGQDNRFFETFSDVCRTLLSAFKELRDLQKQVELSVAMRTPPEDQNAPQEASITETRKISVRGGNMSEFLATMKTSKIVDNK